MSELPPKAMRPCTIVMALALLAPPAAAQHDPPLRVGIIYREAASGHRMVNGIEEAIRDYEDSTGTRILAYRFSYPYEEAGLRIFRDVIQSDTIDVILGPTDSGVFLDLQEFEEDLDSVKILILSPLVTADVGNDRNGWLFRTNVPVSVRAGRIYNDLARRGFNTIAVVYEATGFGDRAELAFREKLEPAQEDSYLALRYREQTEIGDAARRILANRPSAVGHFGSREHMHTLRRELREATHGWVPYDPLLFTIVDASTLCLEGVEFVSLSRRRGVNCNIRPREMQDELTDLGYDAATHLLGAAGEIAGNPRMLTWRSRLRDQMVASMSGPSKPLPRTLMVFSGMENVATPAIRVYRGDSIATLNEAEFGWLQSRIDVRRRRFGLTPLLNLALVVGIVAMLSFLDVRKGHTGGWLQFTWRWTFLRLVLFNVFIAATVLFLLAEVGDIRWDNTVVALTVAFGYTMLLKATIFETPTGQAFGLAHTYEKILKNINRRLMVLRYELEGPRVYYLSYTNSKSWLRQVLERIHSESEDSARANQLLKAADDEADEAESEIEKRRVYARNLLDLMNWRQLVRSRLVPPAMAQYQLYDPATLLREASEYSTNRRKENMARIRGLVERHLEKLRERGGDAHEAAKKELKDRLAIATSERGRVYIRLDWLVVRQVLTVDQIWSQGFVDPEFNPLTLRGRLRTWVANIRGRERRLPPDDPTRERRNMYRLQAEGEIGLTREAQNGGEQKEWAARLLDISGGGARILLEDDKLTGADVLYSLFEVDIRDGPLAGIRSKADCRSSRAVDNGLHLCLEWVDPPEAAVRKIVEYVCPSEEATVGGNGQ